ncbi:MAG: hypothetical protein VX346_27210 [Planctomycetota bacterium]|nr:hypothetical protein [Planctomycetota bacterium]
MSHRISLSTADLSGTALRRDYVANLSAEGSSYAQAYDRTTLWYDAFWRDGRVYLVCPKLMNFAPLIKRAIFRLDQQPVGIAKRRSYQRYDMIELSSPLRPVEISVTGNGFELATPVSRDETGRFAHLNTHFTMTRNNDPEWIRDFAIFSRKKHGLEAMVLFDNGSTDYPLSAVESALRDAGLRDFVIISVPLPYGRKSTTNSSRAKFLQTALMNIARLRILGRARAVLNADIDELVWCREGNVFDKTVGSYLGFSVFSGEWRYPGPNSGMRARHLSHDHRWQDSPRCPAKYCIVPQGRLGNFSWDVHRLTGLPFKQYLRSTDMGFIHCSEVSTNWKGVCQRRGVPADVADWKDMELTFDANTRALLDEGFGKQVPRQQIEAVA